MHERLDRTLRECAAMKKKEKLLFVMDNDPSQRSKLASDALEEVGAELVEITARSLDLNPIENLFNIREFTKQDATDRDELKRSGI